MCLKLLVEHVQKTVSEFPSKNPHKIGVNFSTVGDRVSLRSLQGNWSFILRIHVHDNETNPMKAAEAEPGV